MEIGGLLAIGATAGLLTGVVVLVARGPETLGWLFRAEQPGWPHGVQEDDDFRWRWSGWCPMPPGSDADRRAADDAYRVPPTPVRPGASGR